MELLYIWINQTENEFINNQGVSLTTRYDFQYNLETNELFIEENPQYYNLFENSMNCVVNVSAMVGKNGTGKSSILNHIYSTDLLPAKTAKDDGYDLFTYSENEKSKTIQVYLIDDCVIVYHNLENRIDFRGNTTPKEYHITNETYIQYAEKEPIKSTKIYMTNSQYTSISSSVSSAYGYLSKADLTIRNLQNLSNIYFDTTKKFPVHNNKYDEIYFVSIQLLSIKKKDIQAFQSFLDIKYFEYLFREDRLLEFGGKVSTSLKINVELLDRKLDKLLNEKDFSIRRYSFEGIEDRYDKRKAMWHRIVRKNKDDTFNMSWKLIFNVICEIDFITGYLSDEMTSNLDMNQILEKGLESTKGTNDVVHEYYTKAKKDIEIFDSFISSMTVIDNNLPSNDLAYKQQLKISYDKKPDKYIEFLRMISEMFDKKSFVLKYLLITNLSFSSGERAYLNFFSWLNLLPDLHKIDENVPNNLEKNVILMIDEIDLYCHPEWQQNFLEYLIDEINMQFSDLNVQVIFTTHSPIVLSDIPSSNVVYTSVEDNQQVIENRLYEQTFASNIYKLFNNSFFLSDNGAMGSYAKKKINEAIATIKDTERNNTYTDALKVIDIIGEPLIRNKLINLMDDTSYYQRKKSNQKSSAEKDRDFQMIKKELYKLIRDIDNFS